MQQVRCIGFSQTTWNMKRLPYLNYIGKDGTWNFKFFKWIKQHLHIKSFYGTSENALYLQIWIAICTYLVLAYAKKVMHIDQSLHNISKNVGLFLTDKIPLNDLFNKAVPTEETEDWLYPSLFSPDDF